MNAETDITEKPATLAEALYYVQGHVDAVQRDAQGNYGSYATLTAAVNALRPAPPGCRAHPQSHAAGHQRRRPGERYDAYHACRDGRASRDDVRHALPEE